jgi:hypothetical protein
MIEANELLSWDPIWEDNIKNIARTFVPRINVENIMKLGFILE